MGEEDTYPENTSHLNKWVASSPSQYRKVEKIFHERSLRKVVEEKTAIQSPEECLAIAQTCPLTLEKQGDVLVWFVRSLLDIMTAHQFDFRVADTTLAFYRRFYLRECVVRYPPNLYLFTAMIVAIKCENAVVENRCPSQLFSGTGKATAFHEALEFESILSQTIQFEFFILHGDAPLTHYINSYYGFRKRNDNLTVPSEGWSGPKPRFKSVAPKAAQTDGGDSSGSGAAEAKAAAAPEETEVEVKLSEEQVFVEWLGAVQNACQKMYLQLYAGTTHFVFRPAEIAAGVFVYVTKQTFRLTDIDEFMAAVLPPQIRGDEVRTKNVLRMITLVAHEAFKQDELMKSYDTDYWRPKIQDYLKEARKWVRQLEKKRKAPAESGAEPASKRTKL